MSLEAETVPLAQDASVRAQPPHRRRLRVVLSFVTVLAATTSATRRWHAVETGTLSLDERPPRASPVGASPVDVSPVDRPAGVSPAGALQNITVYCISSTQCTEGYSPAMVMKYMLADGLASRGVRVAINTSFAALGEVLEAGVLRVGDVVISAIDANNLVGRSSSDGSVVASQLSETCLYSFTDASPLLLAPEVLRLLASATPIVLVEATDWSCRVDYPPSTVHSVWRNSYGTGVMSSAEYLPFGIEWSNLTQFYSMAPRASATPTDARPIAIGMSNSITYRRPERVHFNRTLTSGMLHELRRAARDAPDGPLGVYYDYVRSNTRSYTYTYPPGYANFLDVLAACRLFVCTAGDEWADGMVFQALEFGVIPVVLRGPEYKGCRDPAGWLEQRGAPAVFVDAWDELPAALDAALANATRLEERRARLVEWWAATKATVAHKLADAATRYWDADDVPANDCVAEKLSASQEAAYQHQMDAFYAQDHWWDNYEDSPFIAGVECSKFVKGLPSTVHNSTACVSPRCANPVVASFTCANSTISAPLAPSAAWPSRVSGVRLHTSWTSASAASAAPSAASSQTPTAAPSSGGETAQQHTSTFVGCLAALALASCALAVAEREQNVGVLRRLFARAKPPPDAKLPSDAAHSASPWRATAREAAIVLVYLVTIIGLTYDNDWVLTAFFPYSATLTFLQMCGSFAFAATVNSARRKRVFGGVSTRAWARSVLPLSFLFATYLYTSNAVYEYLEVGYIQMLKPAQAAVIIAASAAAGLERVDARAAANLALILCAVSLASVAQETLGAGVSPTGLALMGVSTVAAGLYAVGLQRVMQVEGALGDAPTPDAVTALALVAPPTAALLAAYAAATEWTQAGFTWRNLPLAVLAGDLALAAGVDVSKNLLIGELSAVAYTFAGYTKDFLVVLLSTWLVAEAVSPLQWGAYALLMTAQLLWCLRKLRARFASEPAQPCASDRAESQRATPRRGREARAMGYVAL